MTLQAEHIYTCTGRQRPVFLHPRCREARFAVTAADGDRVRLEVSHDPLDTLKKGKAQWLPFDGAWAGGVFGATALRLVVERLEAWVSLTVAQDLGAAHGDAPQA